MISVESIQLISITESLRKWVASLWRRAARFTAIRVVRSQCPPTALAGRFGREWCHAGRCRAGFCSPYVTKCLMWRRNGLVRHCSMRPVTSLGERFGRHIACRLSRRWDEQFNSVPPSPFGRMAHWVAAWRSSLPQSQFSLSGFMTVPHVRPSSIPWLIRRKSPIQ